MRIPGEGPRISGIYNKNNVKKYGKSSSVNGVKKDEVSISNKAKDFQSVMKALKDVPDIRKDKLEDISKKMESGNFNVSGQQIMDKLMGT
jgi:negative regulator of flagellin synthesis FlgM